jgi:hypothetical protein
VIQLRRALRYAAGMDESRKPGRHWNSFFKQGPTVSADFQGSKQEPAIEDDSIDINLARMQNPLFKRMARTLEHFVPERVGFGRFRGSKK